jgi:hypothetical protein
METSMLATTATAATSPRSTRRLVGAGLLAGLIVNAIDIPNSAALVSPAWTRFLAEHGIAMNVPLVSVFYTTLHFLYGIAIVATYALFRARLGAGTRTALCASGLLVAVHRGFGAGMVAMGTMPLAIYLAFSTSMIAGSLIGGVVAARVYERR